MDEFDRHVDKLSILLRHCEEALHADRTRRKAEYLAASKVLEELLNAVGIEDDDDASLARTAAVLGAASASPCTVLNAMSELLENKVDLECRIQERKAKISHLDGSIRRVLQETKEVSKREETVRGLATGARRRLFPLRKHELDDSTGQSTASETRMRTGRAHQHHSRKAFANTRS